MTSLFDLDENSSDSEEDADYVPEGNVSDVSVSDDDISNEDSPQKSATSRKSRKKRKDAIDDSVKSPQETEKTEITKEKANDIWKSFLVEVEQTNPKENTCESSPITLQSSEKCSSEQNLQNQTSSSSPKKDSIDVLEFAGETIIVPKDGSVADIPSSKADLKDESIKNDITSTNLESPQPSKRKGLQSVLGTIMNKKQKINTLQKSLIDWKSYKKDEGIEEELQNFNRGKGGFIERQRFLERSNIRSYEVERDVRQSKIKK